MAALLGSGVGEKNPWWSRRKIWNYISSFRAGTGFKLIIYSLVFNVYVNLWINTPVSLGPAWKITRTKDILMPSKWRYWVCLIPENGGQISWWASIIRKVRTCLNIQPAVIENVFWVCVTPLLYLAWTSPLTDLTTGYYYLAPDLLCCLFQRTRHHSPIWALGIPIFPVITLWW